MTALERRAGHPGPRDLPGLLPAVVGHLRTCLVAGLGLSATFFMADLLRSMADEGRLVGVVSNMAFVRRWPLYAAIGIGAFGMLTLPALWAFVGQQRLGRRLGNPLILPKRMSTPHLPAFASVALHCVLVTTAVLLLTFIRCCGVMTNHQLEALTLPVAYKSTDGPTPGPRLIVNVRPDGIIRVDGRTLTSQQLRKRLLKDAAEHRGPDGRSRLNVVIRADANVPARHVYEATTACQEAGIDRVFFGVSPRNPSRTRDQEGESNRTVISGDTIPISDENR